MLEDLKFSGTLVSKTHDGAPNMVAGMAGPPVDAEEFKGLPGDSIHCAAHLLNLAVQDLFDRESGPLAGLRQKCRDITTFFSHATLSTRELILSQERSGCKMTKRTHADVITRWNSSYLMMNRLHELKVCSFLVGKPLRWERVVGKPFQRGVHCLCFGSSYQGS